MWAFRHRWLAAAVVSGELALASVVPAVAADSTVSGSGLAIPSTFFGMHIHRVEEPTPWPDSSVGALRTWDAKVRWADLEPAEGRWEFSRLDRIVAGASKRGIDVLIPLGMPAAWASARPAEESAYKPGEAAPPRDMELWRRYVAKVAARYKGKVSTYEIWNEPNLKKFFSGTPAEAVALTCEARLVLRTVAPGAKLVSPAPTGAHGVEWLKDFFAAGGGSCIDIVGFHFYNSHLDPETHLPILAKIRTEMAKAGISSLPVWTTETGWLIRSAKKSISPDAVGFKSTDRVLSDDQSVSLVPRTLILHAAMGIGRFYWYALDNDMMGLFERDGTPKPVWRAYQDTARLLQGRLVGPCTTSEAGIWSCDVKAPAGSVLARVRWLTTPLSERKLPTPQSGARYEVIGRGAMSAIDAQTAYGAGFVVIEWLNK